MSCCGPRADSWQERSLNTITFFFVISQLLWIKERRKGKGRREKRERVGQWSEEGVRKERRKFITSLVQEAWEPQGQFFEPVRELGAGQEIDNNTTHNNWCSRQAHKLYTQGCANRLVGVEQGFRREEWFFFFIFSLYSSLQERAPTESLITFWEREEKDGKRDLELAGWGLVGAAASASTATSLSHNFASSFLFSYFFEGRRSKEANSTYQLGAHCRQNCFHKDEVLVEKVTFDSLHIQNIHWIGNCTYKYLVHCEERTNKWSSFVLVRVFFRIDLRSLRRVCERPQLLHRCQEVIPVHVSILPLRSRTVEV